MSLRNGNPWDITAGVDLDRDGNNQDRPAELVKNSGGKDSEGNLTRTSGDRVVDLRATKQFRFGSRLGFDVFLEAYNLLNAVNFENPSGAITSGSFTTYTTARDARQVQWGARFQF